MGIRCRWIGWKRWIRIIQYYSLGNQLHQTSQHKSSQEWPTSHFATFVTTDKKEDCTLGHGWSKVVEHPKRLQQVRKRRQVPRCTDECQDFPEIFLNLNRFARHCTSQKRQQWGRKWRWRKSWGRLLHCPPWMYASGQRSSCSCLGTWLSIFKHDICHSLLANAFWLFVKEDLWEYYLPTKLLRKVGIWEGVFRIWDVVF